MKGEPDRLARGFWGGRAFGSEARAGELFILHRVTLFVLRLPSPVVICRDRRSEAGHAVPFGRGGVFGAPSVFLARRPAGTVVISPWRHDL